MSSLLFSQCLGVVLAGGKSSRMGQDKSKLQLGTQNMLSFSKNTLLAAGVTDIAISGGEFGIDDIVTNLGPVGGIYSVIKKYQPKALLILPVDLPLMNPKELQQLKRVGELSRKACYFNNHHLPLYLPVNAYLEQFIQQLLVKKTHTSSSQGRKLSGPSVRSLLQHVPYEAISATNEQALFNTNTPEQWQQAKNLISLQRKPYV